MTVSNLENLELYNFNSSCARNLRDGKMTGLLSPIPVSEMPTTVKLLFKSKSVPNEQSIWSPPLPITLISVNTLPSLLVGVML